MTELPDGGLLVRTPEGGTCFRLGGKSPKPETDPDWEERKAAHAAERKAQDERKVKRQRHTE